MEACDSTPKLTPHAPMNIDLHTKSGPTAARPVSTDSSHWYFPDGHPCHSVPRSAGLGDRPTTLRDARKLGLLPSPTTILKVLRKPELESWLTEQAVLAAMTTPRKEGEELDAFIHRVLHVEKQQDQQAQKARDLGTDIHTGIEAVLNGRPCAPDVEAFVLPAVAKMREQFGAVDATEQVVVGNGYAGRADCIFANTILDVKTTGAKTLPSQAYWEARCQVAAYAKAIGPQIIITAILYVSTMVPGELSLCVQTDWEREWRAFEHLLAYWQEANDYFP